MSFDQYAHDWDTKRRIDRTKIISNEIRNTLEKDKYEKALEFGCGTGLISFNLIDMMSEITMVDTSHEMIKIVNEKKKFLNTSKIRSIQMDLMDETLNSTFDVIYTSMVLHHIVETEVILKKLYDLLKPGSEICIIDLDKEDGSFHMKYPEFEGHNGFTHKNMRSMMESIGFNEIYIKTFYCGVKNNKQENVNYSLFRVIAKK